MRFTRCCAVAAFVLVTTLTSGCSRQPTASAPAPAPASDPADRPVELVEVSAAGFEAALREHRGKVVLVDAWFLGCGPCVKKFPHLVELHRKYSGDGLVCVSLDVMEGELESQDRVLDFLKNQGAAFPNYILRDTEENRDALISKYGLVFTPAVILFDRSGAQANVSVRASGEGLERAVKDLLAAK